MEKEVRLIQSIQRAFDIINCFSEQSPKLTLPKISEMLSLNINTTRGIVNTLVANGYLEHDSETNIYSLGPVFIPKADLVSANDMERVKKMARPYLEELSNTFQVSARLQVVSNYNIFTIENINPENAHYILLTRLNTTFALNATASGKLLLHYMGERQRERYFKTLDQRMYTKNTLVTREDLQKELDKIEKWGYSTEFEEIGLGISSIAIPIMKKTGGLYGTVSIVASSSIVMPIIQDVVVPMRKCAEFVSENLLLK